MILVLRFITIVIVVAIGLIPIAFQEKWQSLHDRRTKLHRYTVSLLLALMIVAAFLNGYFAYSDWDGAAQLTSKIDGLVASNQQLNSQIELKTTQIIALSEANAKLSQNIADSIIGGDSYCYVRFYNRGDGAVLPQVEHRGEYPLYDVRVNLVDLDLLNVKTMYNGQWASGNLAPGQSFMLEPLFLEGRKLVRMRAIVSARNGALMQMIHGRKIGKMWQFAMELTRCPHNELIMEEIPNDFPRDPNGHYDWNCKD